MKESELREWITMQGKSLFDRGYTAGGSGNISVKIADEILLTPTNSCLGRLDPDRISKLDQKGNHLAGDKPSKESVLHLAVYQARPHDKAIVHLHSPCAVAVSCLEGLDPDNILPAITPYFVMRIGRLPMIKYFPPGDAKLADAVGRKAERSRAVLMAHHGIVVAGKSLDDAIYTAEELEETARLFFLLKNCNYKVLNESQIAVLDRRFGK